MRYTSVNHAKPVLSAPHLTLSNPTTGAYQDSIQQKREAQFLELRESVRDIVIDAFNFRPFPFRSRMFVLNSGVMLSRTATAVSRARGLVVTYFHRFQQRRVRSRLFIPKTVGIVSIQCLRPCFQQGLLHLRILRNQRQKGILAPKVLLGQIDHEHRPMFQRQTSSRHRTLAQHRPGFFTLNGFQCHHFIKPSSSARLNIACSASISFWNKQKIVHISEGCEILLVAIHASGKSEQVEYVRGTHVQQRGVWLAFLHTATDRSFLALTSAYGPTVTDSEPVHADESIERARTTCIKFFLKSISQSLWENDGVMTLAITQFSLIASITDEGP